MSSLWQIRTTVVLIDDDLPVDVASCRTAFVLRVKPDRRQHDVPVLHDRRKPAAEYDRESP